MKYRIDREATGFNGWQTSECEADSKEEAMEKFKNGDDTFIDEELEVTNLGDIDIDDIVEWDEPMINNNGLMCSFCGKTANEADCLIAGPAVYICNECTVLCMEIIHEQIILKHKKMVKLYRHMWE